jgi:hypothetical protein
VTTGVSRAGVTSRLRVTFRSGSKDSDDGRREAALPQGIDQLLMQPVGATERGWCATPQCVDYVHAVD